MLGKLIKYEWKGSSRILLPLNLFLLLLALLGRISVDVRYISEDLPVITGIAMLFYIFGIFIISFTTSIYLAYRFYKSLFSDEGYLSFTLPVTQNQLLVSKLINFTIWDIINTLICIISIIGLVLRPEVLEVLPEAVNTLIFNMQSSLNISFTFVVIWFIIFVLIGMISSTLAVFAAISIGHSMGKRKILNSFIVYIIIHVIVSITNTIFASITNFSFSGFFVTIESGYAISYSALVLKLVYSIILCVIYFVLSSYFIKNKLNLE
jgi:hypothetical protein